MIESTNLCDFYWHCGYDSWKFLNTFTISPHILFYCVIKSTTLVNTLIFVIVTNIIWIARIMVIILIVIGIVIAFLGIFLERVWILLPWFTWYSTGSSPGPPGCLKRIFDLDPIVVSSCPRMTYRLLKGMTLTVLSSSRLLRPSDTYMWGRIGMPLDWIMIRPQSGTTP